MSMGRGAQLRIEKRLSFDPAVPFYEEVMMILYVLRVAIALASMAVTNTLESPA
jgi:hypothetical protein